MKTNAFPGFDNIKQLYDWNCYTKQDLVDYVNMNCLTKEEYTKNLWRTVQRKLSGFSCKQKVGAG